MFIVFVIGTAGAGKSLLTAAFGEWLKMSKQDVSIVNLDPGVLTLPYSPDVDVRNYVDVENLMEEHHLGPNGALVMAADLVADRIEEISREIEELQSDIVLVDTSGQMELFAFRASGPYITSELTKENKAMVYLFDSVFSVNPLNYVSNLFLSAAVYNRFLLPQIHLVSKCDLLPKEQVNEIVNWSTNQAALEDAIEQKLEGTKRLLSQGMAQAILRLGLKFPLLPVSAKTSEGMINFNMALERALSGGDKYTY
ncbi:MAG: ATP/GTP-binding protein [Candidatus Bathyarchaeia archaeon]